MKRFIGNGNSQYVFQNGMYIPQNQTVKYIFTHKLLEKLGFESFRPLIIIFFIVLIFFGVNQLLLQIFQPLLVYYPGRLLYSSGIDDYCIASIWMYYPRIQSSDQLYTVIMDLTEDTRSASNIFQYSVESFIRFDIVCCIVMFFRMVLRRKKLKWVNKKVFIRLFILVFALMIALAGTLFLNVQRTNNEVKSRCYEAYSILEEKHDDITDLSWDIKVESYLAVIEQDKARYGEDLYYGAFGIRNGFVEYITNAVREFYRFFSNQYF